MRRLFLALSALVLFAALVTLAAKHFDPADYHFYNGIALTMLRRYPQAVEHFKIAATLQPDARVFNNLSVLLAELGREQEAATAAESALGFQRNSTGYLHLARALYKMDKPDEALNAIRMAIPGDPKNIQLYLAQALLAGKANHHDEEIQGYKAALGLAPKNGELWYSLGAAYARAGHPAESIDPLNQAIKFHSKDVHAYSCMAEDLSHLGRFKEALLWVQMARHADPTIPGLNLVECRSYAGTHQFPEAERACQEAIKSLSDASSQAEANFILGAAQVRMKKYSEALADYKVAAQLLPTVPMVHASLGYVYGCLGDIPSALRELNVVRSLDPKMGKEQADAIAKCRPEDLEDKEGRR